MFSSLRFWVPSHIVNQNISLLARGHCSSPEDWTPCQADPVVSLVNPLSKWSPLIP